MKVVDIANEIYQELDAPATLSLPPIIFWLRANVGDLNNHLNENFVINPKTLEIEREEAGKIIEIDEEEKSILKKMYYVHYYAVLLRTTLGAAASDSVVEIQTDDTRVRKINKNELSKTYSFLKKQESDELRDLIFAYKSRQSTPRQVAGNDTVEGRYPDKKYYRDKPQS